MHIAEIIKHNVGHTVYDTPVRI